MDPTVGSKANVFGGFSAAVSGQCLGPALLVRQQWLQDRPVGGIVKFIAEQSFDQGHVILKAT